ncbi:MAG: MFS transporter [Desulfobacteraceae bacterium]|nr:MFS transporter [Desulfobacteraceae bacterium]
MKNKEFHTFNIAILSFSHFIHDIYTSIFPPLLPLIIEKLSLSLSQAGMLSTVLQLPSVLNPFMGVFVDRKRLERWLIILAPTMTAVPMSLIGVANSFSMLLFLLFIAGTSVALYHVPAPVLVAQEAGDKKGRGMSFYMTGGESARALGPIIAIGLISVLSLETFYPIALLAIVTSLILYCTLPPLEKRENSTKRITIMSVVKETKHVLYPVSGILISRSFMHSAMGIFLPVFIERQTGNIYLAGAGLALYEAFGIAGVLCAGTLSDLMGRKKVLFWAIFIAPFALVLFIFTSGLIQVIMLAVSGFTIIAVTPVMLAIIQENANGNPSSANGLFMMVAFFSRAVAIMIVGFLGDLIGLEYMYVACGVIGFAGLPFLMKLKE